MVIGSQQGFNKSPSKLLRTICDYNVSVAQTLLVLSETPDGAQTIRFVCEKRNMIWHKGHLYIH